LKITNRKKEAIPTNITLRKLGEAMSQVDLSSVPPERVQHAVFDHFMRIMGDSVQDGVVSNEIKVSRRLRKKLNDKVITGRSS